MTITILSEKELKWGFDDRGPYYMLGTQYEYVDPHPCFAHDEKLFREEIAKLPLDIKVDWYLCSHESLGRTNGMAFASYGYKDKEKKDYGIIGNTVFFCGKRTPIHPEVTKYLVRHEYGHCVENEIRNILSLERDCLLQWYAKAREIEYSAAYSGREWETNTGEVFANDFRRLLDENDNYWPHPESIPMELTPKLLGWWQMIFNQPKEQWTINY